jgi:4'-phosphopantetheinyl transferase
MPTAADFVLHPVVFKVPETNRHLAGREKVAFLSQLARQALACSARLSALPLGPLGKDDRGAPRPSLGTFWSISHKSSYVAAIAAPAAVGIDIERIRPVRPNLFGKTASQAEWALVGDASMASFFRFWTAKEAALKAAGCGLQGLSTCRITRVPDARHIEACFLDHAYGLEQIYFDEHIASIVSQGLCVHWHLPGPWPQASRLEHDIPSR